MLKAAGNNGWLDERKTALESLMAIRRAGADLIFTYYARQAARWLAEESRREGFNCGAGRPGTLLQAGAAAAAAAAAVAGSR